MDSDDRCHARGGLAWQRQLRLSWHETDVFLYYRMLDDARVRIRSHSQSLAFPSKWQEVQQNLAASSACSGHEEEHKQEPALHALLPAAGGPGRCARHVCSTPSHSRAVTVGSPQSQGKVASQV